MPAIETQADADEKMVDLPSTGDSVDVTLDDTELKVNKEDEVVTEDIIIENTSRNTKENAFNSAEILKKQFPNGDFLLITSATHMKRAQLCFDIANLKTTAFPTDCTTSYTNFGIEYLLLPRVSALEVWENLIHEWIGYLVYKIKF